MKLFGLILLIFGVIKVFITLFCNKDKFIPISYVYRFDLEDLYGRIMALLVVNGAIEIICGIFIAFML